MLSPDVVSHEARPRDHSPRHHRVSHLDVSRRNSVSRVYAPPDCRSGEFPSLSGGGRDTRPAHRLLRDQLGFFRDYIQTVPYIGYRFKA